MRTFHCDCGAQVFFDNTQCLSCGRWLGFLPDRLELAALPEEGNLALLTPHGSYRKCKNYEQAGVCNWMIPEAEQGELCQACRLNNVIPDLSRPENRALWLEVEKAKRRLVYGLNRLALPIVPKSEDPLGGLSFDIKSDEGVERVLTGHSDGLITLNLVEADAPEREKIRLAMKERYRTLLGHFRHEIGHYYWDRLLKDTPEIPAFRALFGDETLDYAEALKRHYASEPEPGYPDSFITHYAASHPWEDFAETFAHYLHMVDTLETAEQFGLVIGRARGGAATEAADFDALMTEWLSLTVALNALNRSMGLPDAYPFAISPNVKQKLEFVHDLVRAPAPRAEEPAMPEPLDQPAAPP